MFRSVVNCCAAAATPVALLLEGDDAGELKNDDWIAASGTFRIRRIGEHDLLVLEKASIRAAEASDQPYLYMQWGIF